MRKRIEYDEIYEVFSDGLTDKQIFELFEFYSRYQKRTLFNTHRKVWFNQVSTNDLMKLVNENDKIFCGEYNYPRSNNQKINEIWIEDTHYLWIVGERCGLVLYDTLHESWHQFNKISWMSSGVFFWVPASSYYGRQSDSQFYQPCKNERNSTMKFLQNLDEYKYIELSEFDFYCPYVMLMYKDQKERLWQVEMLKKSGYKKLANELLINQGTLLDFKVIKKYSDYFKKRGVGLWQYENLLKLIKDGFDDPSFLYIGKITSYCYGFYARFFELGYRLRFIKEVGINKKRFIEYIRNRKSSITKMGIHFIDEYFIYLEYCAKVGLDLTRSKYAFPDDLDQEFESILYLDKDKDELFKYLLSKAQVNLSEEKQTARYKEIIAAQKLALKQAKEREEKAAKKRAEIRNRKLAKLWEMCKGFRYEITDDLILVAPTSSEDLFIEGKTLNHCVGNYIEYLAKGEKMIYFLRKKDHEDKPFYTIEVRNGKAVQVRTTNNMQSEDITNLVASWCESHQDRLLQL